MSCYLFLFAVICFFYFCAHKQAQARPNLQLSRPKQAYTGHAPQNQAEWPSRLQTTRPKFSLHFRPAKLTHRPLSLATKPAPALLQTYQRLADTSSAAHQLPYALIHSSHMATPLATDNSSPSKLLLQRVVSAPTDVCTQPACLPYERLSSASSPFPYTSG